MEGSDKRYLTGADFDVESIQPVADGFWVGEELGPYILKFSTEGVLTDVIATKAGEIEVKSPDNPTLVVPANPAAKMPAFNLKRSGGYEGLAMSKDGTKLYGMLEGPLYLEDGSVEKADGLTALRIIELDAASKAWTGKTWLYPLSEGGEAIGDFNMIDETTALVIERDNGAGVVEKACADPKAPAADCFAVPAKHKRIYKIEMTDEMAGKAVRKIGYIDLMKIEDPDNKKRQAAAKASTTCLSSPSRMSTWSIRPTSSSATTTTCPSRPVVRSTRLMTANSFCSKSAISWRRSKRLQGPMTRSACRSNGM